LGFLDNYEGRVVLTRKTERPGTEKVDSLDISRSAEREIQLDGGHYCGFGGDVYI
jgi:hypothetical protein